MSNKLSEKDVILLKKIVGIFRALDVNSLMNAYAIENVVFGDLKQGEKIPFDKFVSDLQIAEWRPHAVREYIEGTAINGDETVADKGMEFFYRENFSFHMNYIFESAPYSKRKECDEYGLFPFVQEGLNAYIMSFYPLFKQVLQTEVKHEFFEIVSPFPDRAAQTDCYIKIAKFLVAVKTRRLRQGGCVDRYVKNLPYLPYYVKRILKVKNGRYLLANSDTESIEFRLAVLSAIHFMNAEHTQIFELKSRDWEHKANR